MPGCLHHGVDAVVIAPCGGVDEIYFFIYARRVSIIDPTYGFILFHNIKRSEVAAEVAPKRSSG